MKALSSLTLLAALLAAAPATTAAEHVYRGTLLDQDLPANGDYALRLTLFDRAEGGLVIDAPVMLDEVRVNDGGFAVPVSIDPGRGGWLEVEVAAEDGVYHRLPERQPVGLSKAAVGATCWSTAGNVGNTPIEFFGTTDAQPIELRVNNARLGRLSRSTGGEPQIAIGASSVLAAGVDNAVVVGGRVAEPNAVHDHDSVVGGGAGNVAGNENVDPADAAGSTVSGGRLNRAMAALSTAAGGGLNTATRHASTVSGGQNNIADGQYSTVPGGAENVAGGQFSLAAGVSAVVRPVDAHSFVWSGSVNGLQSTGSGQFLVGAPGGVAFNTNMIGVFEDLVVRARGSANGSDDDADLALVTTSGAKVSMFATTDGGGVALKSAGVNHYDYALPEGGSFNIGNGVTSGRYINTGANGAHLSTGGTWTNGSSRLFKHAVAAIDPQSILEGVLKLPIARWQYRGSQEGEHLGPMAEDFAAAFGLGADDAHIATVDADGVALAAIQALHAQLDAQRAVSAALAARLAGLERALAERAP